MATASVGSYVNLSLVETADVPYGVVTRTCTVPRACAGTTTLSLSLETTLIDLPATAPNLTLVARSRFAPRIVTRPPPRMNAFAGDIDESRGGGTYLKCDFVLILELPRDVMTRTGTDPAAWLGAITVNFDRDITCIDLPAFAPKCTARTRTNPEPRIVTRVPPESGPADGETVDVVGPAAAYAGSAAAAIPPANNSVVQQEMITNLRLTRIAPPGRPIAAP